jgi:ectoine hydroxylase-related dioxygenase (phytanoyl-CoA dioxygenase family)
MHAQRFDETGFVVLPSIISQGLIDDLRGACERLPADGRRSRAGIRDLLRRDPTFADLAGSRAVRDLVDPILGPTAFVTRSILFDKTLGTNWDVVWHQDITIAVQERIEAPGFGPWSVKAGVPHVQPPAQVLENILTVRIHLDDCLEDNGPLLVVPGSHKRGILPEASINPDVCEQHKVGLCAPAGGTILMRPLILHASRKAANPAHRRVVHLEFARGALPGGLAWARL